MSRLRLWGRGLRGTPWAMSLLSDLSLSRRPLVAFLAVGFGWGCFAGLVPAVKAQIGASDALYGGLSLFASLGALAAMWLAPLSFRLFGRWAIVLGCCLISLGFSLTGTVSAPAVFAATMLVAAMGTGIADVLANAELSEIEARSGRSLMNLNHGMYSFAFAGAAVVSGLLRDRGWSPAEILLLLAAVILALCLVAWGPKPDAEPGGAAPNSGSFPKRLVLLGGFVLLAAFSSEAATEGWSALHLERSLGADAAGGALGPALFGICMGIGRFSGHVLGRFVSDVRLMSVAAFMAGSGLALAGAAPTLGIAYVGFACAGLGISVVVPLAIALVGRTVPAQQRLAAVTRITAMGYAAFFFGPPLMGLIAQVFGLRVSFAVVAVVLVLVSLLLVPALGRQAAMVMGARKDPPAV